MCGVYINMIINMYYDSICKVLNSVDKLTILTNKFKCSQDNIVPGFNEHLKELHCDARAQYLIWRNDGKPRTGEPHRNMRNSRLRFKVLEICTKNLIGHSRLAFNNHESNIDC